jgi:hypothetical protein
MQPAPELESVLRLAFEARDPAHPSGISLASYFVRAPTRGRRRSELERELLFPPTLPIDESAVARALDPATWRSCASTRPAVPIATREWLAEAALTLGRAEGFAAMWSLLRATSELEALAQKLLGPRTPRAVVRQVLHGVDVRTLRAEPFAAFVVRVLKIAQAVYAAFRHAGFEHQAAWAAVQDRLWAPYPTGRRKIAGGAAMGAYLPSLLQAASGHARRRLRRNAETRRTQDDARALLARFNAMLWPWTDAAGRLLPQGETTLSPEMAGLCFFVLLTQTASERRSRGGPSGGLSAPFAEAGFGASEWLPDRTDDVAIRLLRAAGIPRAEMLDRLSLLLRATLSPGSPAQRLGIDLGQREAEGMLERARERLPELLRWLEENARELLERT